MTDAPAPQSAKAGESPVNKRANPEQDDSDGKPFVSVDEPRKEAKKGKTEFGKGMVIWIKADSYNPVWEKVKLDSDENIETGELQRLVGGHIEAPPMEHIFKDKLPEQSGETRHLELYCNEEGRNMGLPLNEFGQEFGLRGVYGLAGDVVICVGTPDGDSTFFTKEDLKLLPKALIP